MKLHPWIVLILLCCLIQSNSFAFVKKAAFVKQKAVPSTPKLGGKKLATSAPHNSKKKEVMREIVKLEEKERIQKLIARSGLASRRDAERMVRKRTASNCVSQLSQRFFVDS